MPPRPVLATDDVNEPRSSRYQRAKRRAGCLWAVTSVLFFAAALATGFSMRLSSATGGGVVPCVLAICGTYALATFPITCYRGFRLERQYELSHVSFGVWLRDYTKMALLNLAMVTLLAEIVYRSMWAWSGRWWLIAGGGAAVLLGAMTAAAPFAVLPLFHRYRPLGRAGLRERITALATRVGLQAPDVHECRLGERDRRAHAAIVGAGPTRRIVLSDTLVSDYTDDEIEVIVAHEIGHHQHRDMLKGLVVEGALLLGAFYAVDLVLTRWWRAVGLVSPHDVAGLPLVILVGLGVGGCAAPFVLALSRRNEMRADAFALAATARPDAFIAAARRMAAQNLAEERPSRLTLWLFHTHPAVADRIAMAQAIIAARPQAAGQEAGGAPASSSARRADSPVEPAGV